MFKNYELTLDIATGDARHPLIQVNTNDLDSFKISFIITQHKEPIDLTGKTIRIAILKPDRKTVLQDCALTDAENGKGEVILDTQAYALGGKHYAEVMVYDGAEKVAVTGRFVYNANRGILNDGTVESTNEWQSIHQAIADAENILIDLRENGTGVDAQAREDLESVTAQLAHNTQKLNDILYNVKDYFVSGESNYSAAFQRANDALVAVGGGTLYVPRGTYYANFILDSNVQVKGDGVNVSIIKSVAGSNKDVIKGRDFDTFTGTTADVTTDGVRFISIRDITIDGNKANNTSGYGIRLWGCFWDFNNVVVQFCANDGIWTEFTSILSPTEATARTAALESMFRNIKILYCNGNAWTFNGPHDSIIDNYVAIGNTGWALYQREFNSFLTGENWNVWKNGNGFYVGTGLAGHDIVADNDGTGIGLEFHKNGGNSRIVNGRFSGWDVGIILRGQAQNIKAYVQNSGLNSDGSAVRVEDLSLSHLVLIAINNNCVLDMISEISKNSFVVTASVPSGKVLQRGANIRNDSFAQLNSGGTGLMQLAENSLKVKGWTFTFPTNNGTILTTNSAPTTTDRGGIKTQGALPDVTAAPTAGEFNTLLSRLRAAGIIASS